MCHSSFLRNEYFMPIHPTSILVKPFRNRNLHSVDGFFLDGLLWCYQKISSCWRMNIQLIVTTYAGLLTDNL
jgi:hypothetical protein